MLRGVEGQGSDSLTLVAAFERLGRLPCSSGFFFEQRGTLGRVKGFIFSNMQRNTHFHHVPTFGGKATSFLDYEQRVNLRDAATDIPPEKRAT